MKKYLILSCLAGLTFSTVASADRGGTLAGLAMSWVAGLEAQVLKGSPFRLEREEKVCQFLEAYMSGTATIDQTMPVAAMRLRRSPWRSVTFKKALLRELTIADVENPKEALDSIQHKTKNSTRMGTFGLVFDDMDVLGNRPYSVEPETFAELCQ